MDILNVYICTTLYTNRNCQLPTSNISVFTVYKQHVGPYPCLKKVVEKLTNVDSINYLLLMYRLINIAMSIKVH